VPGPPASLCCSHGCGAAIQAFLTEQLVGMAGWLACI